MNRQIALQETLNQQWLDIINWRREGGASREENPPKFGIAAEIVNPTNVPLTINVLTIGIRGEQESYGTGNVLAPSQTVKIAIPFVVNSESDLAAYSKYGLVLTVYGSIEYTDAFKKKQTQPFSCTGIFGPGHYARFSAIPLPRQV
jgi:hypothetical protein